jgi:4-aminobutyrate aminotransferase-like enzyme
MDSVPPGGLGGTFGGYPLACAAACAVLDEVATDGFRARATHVAELLRHRLDAIAARHDAIGEMRGLGAMLALELAEPTPELAGEVTRAAYERGLIVLSCGIYGNVIRLLPPFAASDEELVLGLDLLEESLGDAGASAR